MTAIASLAAVLKAAWNRIGHRGTMADALAHLGPNMCKEAGLGFRPGR